MGLELWIVKTWMLLLGRGEMEICQGSRKWVFNNNWRTDYKDSEVLTLEDHFRAWHNYV